MLCKVKVRQKVNLFLYLSKQDAMKTDEGVE
jgi:hypothetical protein